MKPRVLMRSMVILLCFGLSACGGSLSDALGPGASAFPVEPDETVPVTTTTVADTGSDETTPSTPPPTSAPIDLADWNASWPASWGEESPFFGGWMRFTGGGSRAFANNVTAEVFPADTRSDEEMLAMMEQVLVAIAADVVVTERLQNPHPNGFVELTLRYEYPVAGETVKGTRSLFRGTTSSLLVTLTASSATFGDEITVLRTALDSLTSS